jgi:hypothetical protein
VDVSPVPGAIFSGAQTLSLLDTKIERFVFAGILAAGCGAAPAGIVTLPWLSHTGGSNWIHPIGWQH